MEINFVFWRKIGCLSVLALELERNTNLEMEIERCFFGEKI